MSAQSGENWKTRSARRRSQRLGCPEPLYTSTQVSAYVQTSSISPTTNCVAPKVSDTTGRSPSTHSREAREEKHGGCASAAQPVTTSKHEGPCNANEDLVTHERHSPTWREPVDSVLNPSLASKAPASPAQEHYVDAYDVAYHCRSVEGTIDNSKAAPTAVVGCPADMPREPDMRIRDPAKFEGSVESMLDSSTTSERSQEHASSGQVPVMDVSEPAETRPAGLVNPSVGDMQSAQPEVERLRQLSVDKEQHQMPQTHFANGPLINQRSDISLFGRENTQDQMTQQGRTNLMPKLRRKTKSSHLRDRTSRPIPMESTPTSPTIDTVAETSPPKRSRLDSWRQSVTSISASLKSIAGRKRSRDKSDDSSTAERRPKIARTAPQIPAPEVLPLWPEVETSFPLASSTALSPATRVPAPDSASALASAPCKASTSGLPDPDHPETSQLLEWMRWGSATLDMDVERDSEIETEDADGSGKRESEWTSHEVTEFGGYVCAAEDEGWEMDLS